MPRLITEKTFYQYLKCPHWVYFSAQGGDKKHEALMDKLIDGGLIEEKERELISDRKELVEVTAEDPEQAFYQTLEYMREGRQTIYHGVLIDKHWVGHPDILEKVEGKSKFGDYYYVAADIKNTRHIYDEHKFQGCFYAELLGLLQGAKPRQGYVITPDNSVLEYLIEEFEGHYHLTLDAIERVVAGQEPPHFMTSGCKQSPWYSECRSLSESCADLSMLNRVWRQEVARLKKAGYETIESLADKSVAHLIKQVPDVAEWRLEIMRDQALALRDNRYIIRQSVDLPEADTELYFDIESDPLRDFIYLFGVYEVSQDKQEYHAFMANYTDKEDEMWAEFAEFMASHIDCPVYHYGSYERDVVSRFAAKYGCSDLVREALERNLIDVLELIRPAVIFPLSFYSLKDIGAYVGYHWRAEDASGANSVLWFEDWLRTKSDDLKKKILEYNEDDVIATYKVQRWLREKAT
ncbi:TM0106 family RecB-like putative nuclease [Patescibacteria group bacterium]|nr:TM0106 family RecB-like putative nuclease [Patescibacteria group bacterium]